jgi:uncharacterized membrane protein
MRLVNLLFITMLASGCTTIGGGNNACALIGATIGAGAGGAVGNVGGAVMGALGGAVMSQYFCGEEEIPEVAADECPDDEETSC